MTAKQIARAVELARAGQTFEGVDDFPLWGIALDTFESGKVVTMEAIVKFLRWQCQFLNGGWDGRECNNLVPLLRRKVICAEEAPQQLDEATINEIAAAFA